MKFLGDANLSPAVARLLNAFDQQNEVHALSDFWPQHTSDSVWIREVRAKLADEHPVILGGDGRILRNKPELLALKQEGLTFVYLAPGWTQLSWAEFAWRIIKAWPAVVTNVGAVTRPTDFEVKVSSLKVEKAKLLSECHPR